MPPVRPPPAPPVPAVPNTTPRPPPRRSPPPPTVFARVRPDSDPLPVQVGASFGLNRPPTPVATPPPSAVVTKFGGGDGGGGSSEVQVGTSFGIGSSEPVSLAASARPPAKYRVGENKEK